MSAADRIIARVLLYSGITALAVATCCSLRCADATSAAPVGFAQAMVGDPTRLRDLHQSLRQLRQADAKQEQQPPPPSVAVMRLTAAEDASNGNGGSPAPAQQPTGPLRLPPLPYDYSALEPVISSKIMQLHHDTHEATYVDKANAAIRTLVAASPSSPAAAGGASDGGSSGSQPNWANMTLSELLLQVGRGTMPASSETAIRNNGGGHWNHQAFWKVMAAPNSPATSRANISPALLQAINRSFGSVDQMLAALKASADGRFGSGWAWVCLARDGALRVLSTPNQDNPLMAVVSAEPCTPVLAVDVWEHAYYLQYGPKRSDYTTAWMKIINWKKVSENFDAAKRGDLGVIGAAD